MRAWPAVCLTPPRALGHAQLGGQARRHPRVQRLTDTRPLGCSRLALLLHRAQSYCSVLPYPAMRLPSPAAHTQVMMKMARGWSHANARTHAHRSRAASPMVAPPSRVSLQNHKLSSSRNEPVSVLHAAFMGGAPRCPVSTSLRAAHSCPPGVPRRAPLSCVLTPASPPASHGPS